MKKLIAFVLGLILSVPAMSAGLPSGYTEFDYIVFDGNTYIDTGITSINSGATVKIKFAPTTDTGTRFLYGQNPNEGLQQVGLFLTNTSLYWQYGTPPRLAYYPVSAGTIYDLTLNNGSMIINGTTKSGETTTAFDLDRPVLIGGAWSSSSSVDSRRFVGKIYSFSYTLDNNTVAIFVPAKRNSDNAIGMYNILDSNPSTAFKTNAGTGSFIAGPTIIPNTFERLKYIESTGTQWIDTGIVPNEVDNLYIKFKNTTTNDGYLIGAANGSLYNYVGIHGPAFNGYGENWGDGANYKRFDIPADTTNIHTIEVDLTSTPEFYFDGVLKATQSVYATISSTSTFIINENIYGSPTKRPHAQYYEVKLSKNNALVQALVPVKRISDGEVGMFDTVTGAFLTNSGTGDFVAGPSAVMKIATTKYNTNAFSGVVTALNNAVDTIKTVVANTINQATAVANLHSGKQQRPDESCPAGKTCLLVEDANGNPHWYEIVESYVAPNSSRLPSGYTELQYIQSSGDAYIDTGVAMTSNYERVVAKFSAEEAFRGYGWRIFGSQNDSGCSLVPWPVNDNTNPLGYLAVGNSWYLPRTQNNAISTSLYTPYEMDVIANNGTVSGTYCGYEFSSTYTGTVGNGLKVTLFKNNGQAVSGSGGRIYYFKMWTSANTLAFDGVPAKNSNNEYGIYDFVSKEFKKNANNSGSFTGPVAQ